MNNRNGLLDAALVLFAARGYEAVGVQEIAAMTSVTKPTLYHFFGSKLGLLQALFEEYGGPLDEAVLGAADYQGDLPLSLDRIANAYFTFSARQPAYYRFELAAWIAARESDPYRLAAAYYSRRRDAIEQVFRRAVREHGNMRGREHRYAVSLLGHINSYIALQLDERLIITDSVRHDIVRQFSHGIYS